MKGIAQLRAIAGDWHPGFIPGNVTLGERAVVETSHSFEKFGSVHPEALAIGEGTGIYSGTMFDVGPMGRIRIGRGGTFNGPRLICDTLIEIGDFALISWNVVLMDSYRVPMSAAERRQHRRNPAAGCGDAEAPHVPRAPIRIGNNVWIGFDACILPGVTIGNDSVVAARSVLFESVPPGVLAAGNPARVIRTLA